MIPVLILTHNNLELTKKCITSVLTQDVPTNLLVWDNASTDGTANWLPDNSEGSSFMAYRSQINQGVSKGWNWGIDYFFTYHKANYVLVPNNDTILPPYFLSELLAYDVPFVTGVSVDSMDKLHKPEPRNPLSPCPDFSAFLIRRDAWEKTGPFDENMKHYASDNDWHVRAHRVGIPLMNSHVPFYHERSSTLRTAPDKERHEIQLQADADREVFRTKYGCLPWEDAYRKLFETCNNQ